MATAKRGRKKIELVRMKNDINLQITFSKRKHSVFKKASELGTLCGGEIGVIMFSPGQKAFSFGTPDIRSVINRFNNHHHHPLRFIERGPNATIQNLNNMLTQESEKLEVEKENKKSLDQLKIMREETENWWNKPPNQLDLTQTNSLIKALEDLKMELRSQQPQPFQPCVPQSQSQPFQPCVPQIQSQPFQTCVPQSYYGGSYNNIVGGGNTNPFDQRRMIDVNAMNYNPNMVIPNHGSMPGYNNNNNVFEGFPPI